MPASSPLQTAITAAGGQSALARRLHCTPQAVQRWCRTGHIPAGRVVAIERISGVGRELLRPDLYRQPA